MSKERRQDLLARRLRQNIGVVETRPRSHGVSREMFAPLLKRRRDGVFRASCRRSQLARSGRELAEQVSDVFYYRSAVLFDFIKDHSLHFQQETTTFQYYTRHNPCPYSQASIYFFVNFPNRFLVLCAPDVVCPAHSTRLSLDARAPPRRRRRRRRNPVALQIERVKKQRGCGCES